MASPPHDGPGRADRAGNPERRRAHGRWSDLALHTIGWRAFQDLCWQVCEVVLGRPVEIFREAQDGGQDAVFVVLAGPDAPIGTVYCKHTSEVGKALKVADLTAEIGHVEDLVKAFMTNMSVDAPVAAAASLEHDQERSRSLQRPSVGLLPEP